MDLKNAAQFDHVVVRVLSALADAFPVAINLDFHALGIVDGPAYKASDFEETATASLPEHQFAAMCVRFLHSEGYVSGTVHHAHATYIVLTAKGLDLIGGPPSSLRVTH